VKRCKGIKHVTVKKDATRIEEILVDLKKKKKKSKHLRDARYRKGRCEESNMVMGLESKGRTARHRARG